VFSFIPYSFSHTTTFRKKLSDELEKGINNGYVGNIFDMEKKIKRSMLLHAAHFKEHMWELYGIPKNMIRGIGYVESVLKNKISKENILNVVSHVQNSEYKGSELL